MFHASLAEIVHLLADSVGEIKELRKIPRHVPLVVAVETPCDVEAVTARGRQGLLVWLPEITTPKTAFFYEAERWMLSFTASFGVCIRGNFGSFAMELQRRLQVAVQWLN